ncbi:ABC transporter ATP-binding protein [Parvicella tangerina]|uniref:Lipid A export ATP-binding/permease protein MsbA n=1 Tax=Parvicella tangerina TaxID=2829795 RepID=A0A916NBT6_9FLAO|nr:ABC transporter ATP-binding protein [Parvicella tangerina]CAG5083858.1 Lipid A export ATP-binding/permease protein MsbA [Parvicella tangerina]
MKSLIRIIKLTLGYKKYIAGSVFFNLLSTFFGLFSFVLLAPLLDVIFNKTDDYYAETVAKGAPEFSFSSDYFVDFINHQLASMIVEESKVYALVSVCIVIGIAVLLKNLFIYLSTLLVSVVVNKSVGDIRNNIFNTLMYMPVSYLSDERKGEVISKTSNDVQEIEWSMQSAIKGVFKEPINILVFLITLFAMSLELSLFIVIFLPVTGALISLISKSLKKNTKSAQEHFGRLMAHLEESLNGFKLIKAFSNEDRFVRKFEGTNSEFVRNKVRAYAKADLASPTSEFLGVIAVISVLWYGGSLVFEGEMQASFFITYIILFSQLINPLKTLSKSIYDAQKGNSALDRIEEIYQAKDQDTIVDGALVKAELEREVTVKNISFSYKTEKVLNNVSFTVQKGKTVALVGQSGSGKSTIANLVPRFYDVQEGSIEVDGVNIKDFKLQALRDLIGMVTQESILFNDTVTNNIVFGDEVDQEKLIEAAKIANAHDFISELEEGYETNIGDGGNKLSGGQRQRLSIARAVYKNPPILILDEATSALDTESEKLVQDALNKLMANRTSIVIAHRLSTIQHADEIIVLQKGNIVERGSHQELMDKNGTYRKLVEMQSFD